MLLDAVRLIETEPAPASPWTQQASRPRRRWCHVCNSLYISLVVPAESIHGCVKVTPPPGLQDRDGFRGWLHEMLEWWLHSPNGALARQIRNNIGNAYDYNGMAMATFLGNASVAARARPALSTVV